MSIAKTISSNCFKIIKSINKRGFITIALTLLMITMLFASCSTPKNAVTVKDSDGNESDIIETGEYLALLYQTFSHSNYSRHFQSYGITEQALDLDYPGVETGNKQTFEKHMIQTNIDNIAYLEAVKKMMKDNNIEFSDKDNKQIETSLAGYDLGDKLGFNKANYEKSLRRSYSDTVLFKALYGEGGSRAVSEDDMNKYYESNIYYYKIIEKSLVDEENADLKEAEKELIKTKLNEYLTDYNNSEIKDFNAVIKKHYDDNRVEGDKDFEVDTKIKEIEQNLESLNVANNENTSLADQINTIKFGEAKIVEYVDAKAVKKMAIIYRIDAESTDNYNFKDRKEDILFTMKYADYKKEVTELAAKYKVDVTASVRKKCTPRQMIFDMNKKS